eukprot:gene6736-4830_t
MTDELSTKEGKMFHVIASGASRLAALPCLLLWAVVVQHLAFSFTGLEDGLVSAESSRSMPPSSSSPFSTHVVNGVGCLVCRDLIVNVAVKVQTYLDVKGLESLSDMGVDEYLQGICNPYVHDGAWLRRISLTVPPPSESGEVRLVIGMLPEPSYCTRACATVQEACELVLEHSAFDNFAKNLSDMTRVGRVTVEQVINDLFKAHCMPIPFCSQMDAFIQRMQVMINSPVGTLRSEIEADEIVFVPQKEYRLEFPQGERNGTVIKPFTREELQKITASVAPDEPSNDAPAGPQHTGPLPSLVDGEAHDARLVASVSVQQMKSPMGQATCSSPRCDAIRTKLVVVALCCLSGALVSQISLCCSIHINTIFMWDWCSSLPFRCCVLYCSCCCCCPSMTDELSTKEGKMFHVIASGASRLAALPCLLLWAVVVLQLAFSFTGLEDGMRCARAARASDATGFYPFSVHVGNAAGCTVCRELVGNAAVQAQTYIDVKKKNGMTPYEMEEFLQSICDPMTQDGGWIRRIGFFVIKNDETAASEGVNFGIGIMKQASYCRRTCATVQETCDFIVDYTSFDSFSKGLSEWTYRGRVDDVSVIKELFKEYCSQFFFCAQVNYTQDVVDKMLNDPNKTTRAEIEAEVYLPVPKEEYYKEFPPVRRRGTVITPFTKEEIEELEKMLDPEEIASVERYTANNGPQRSTSPDPTTAQEGDLPFVLVVVEIRFLFYMLCGGVVCINDGKVAEEELQLLQTNKNRNYEEREGNQPTQT